MRLVVLTNQWQSGEIRGRQVAQRLSELGHKVAVDPNEVSSDDTVLSVKAMLPDELVKHAKRVLLDVVDSGAALAWARSRPSIEIIAISKTAEQFLRAELPKHKVWFLPEHHCNREGAVVKVAKPKVLGYCGTPEGMQLSVEEVGKAVKDAGFVFAVLANPTERELVCSFYRQIDVQLCWRPNQPHPELKNPLKLANAGSFGVPTIAWPEVSYVAEWPQEFIQAKSLDDIVWALDILRKPESYQAWSQLALSKSAEYSLERVVSMYEEAIYG